MGFKNAGVMVQEYEYDFDKDGGAQGVIVLSAKDQAEPVPVGSIIKRYTRKVETAFTSGGAATVAVGDNATPADYEAAAAVAGLTANSLAEKDDALKLSSATTGTLEITIAAADLTAGKATYLVEYYTPKSAA